MAIEQNGFDLGQKRVVAIDVRPACLHHADFRIGEVMDALHQKVGWRDKIGVKDGNVFAFSRFQSYFQSAGFVAFTIVAMQVIDGMSQRSVAIDQNAGDLHGFVGGIIQQLDVEFVFRIFEAADRVKQPFHDVLLVKNGQLHGDARQVFGVKMRCGFRRLVLFVLVIKIDQPVAVSSVCRQNNQHDEIGNQQRQVERVDLVETLKSLVQKVLAQIGPKAFGGKDQDHSQRGRSGHQIHELNRTVKQREREQTEYCTGSVVSRWSVVVSKPAIDQRLAQTTND